MAVISYSVFSMDIHSFGEASGSYPFGIAPRCHLLLSYGHFSYGSLRDLQAYVCLFACLSLLPKSDYRPHEGMGHLTDTALHLAL